jgi:hypothetical protein
MGDNSSLSQDPSSYYDRIIPSIANLSARIFGQHDTLCFIHATFFRKAKYNNEERFAFGLSEGSTPTSPAHEARHLQVFMIAFVNHSFAGVNDFTNSVVSSDPHLQMATALAQLSNDLLSERNTTLL